MQMMKLEDAVAELKKATSTQTSRQWAFFYSVSTVLAALEEAQAKLELLNGTAATKIEKHNAEMEKYKAEVIKLREEGVSWAMIAERTGINASTVRSWVRNAK